MHIAIIKKLVLPFLFILFVSTSYSQVKISGRVLSKEKTAIYLANITIPGSSYGTTTNKTGNFEFSIDKDNTKKSFIISSIGYKSKTISVDSLIKCEANITIFLERQSYFLSEVIIKKQEILYYANQIFARAIDSIPSRLDDNPNIGKYYFRQIHRDDSTINRIIEAAISIYDPGIDDDIKKCKINIDEIKTSLDNRIFDYKRLLELYHYMVKKKKILPHPQIKSSDSYEDKKTQKVLLYIFDKREASLANFHIKANMIRGVQYKKRKKSLLINPYFTGGRPIITKSFVKEHRFKLDTILMYQGEPVYKVKILPNKKYPQIKSQENELIPIGISYIRVKDFALLYLDYGYITNPQYKHYKGNMRFYYRFKIQFKEYNNKLYLNYLSYTKSDYNKAYYKNKKQKQRGRQIVTQELMNTKIIKDKDSVNKTLNTLEWDANQYIKRSYREEFWDKYSTILPSHEEQLLKEKLKKEISKK